MLEFARWKYVVMAIVLFISTIYSLPNLYPKDAAVQVSALHGAKVDQALVARVDSLMKANRIQTKSVALEDKNVVVRLKDKDRQSAAFDLIKLDLGTENYNTALNLASTVPGWLQAIHARPMALGLDLQGGVHFLLEVDDKAALEKRSEGYADSIRSMLRENQIPFISATRTGSGIIVMLSKADDLEKAQNRIGGAFPELQVAVDSSRPNALGVTIPPAVIKQISDDAIEQNMTTIRNRIGSLGEPVVQRQGRGRIVVEIPGLQDTAEAKKRIGATATLEYRAVLKDGPEVASMLQTGLVPPDGRIYFMKERGPNGAKIPILLSKRTIVTGDQMINAVARLDPTSGTPSVEVTLNKAGGDRMFAHTRDNVGNLMAAVFIETVTSTKVVDGKEVRTSKVTEEVVSAARLQGVFSNQFQTTGLGSMTEAQDLAQSLKAGSLAAPMVIAEERIVGPSLGAENIKRGSEAVFFSFAFVLVFFLIYYKTFGIVTNLALLIELLIMVAMMSILGATMSLPGLAGLALTVGMSVDANVLINERIREELRLGNTPLTSIAAGYDKASGTIWDANVTALLGGLAMWGFGSGPVKGFGITLVIGIICSMYTAVEVSRGIATLIYGFRKKKLTKINI